MFVPDFEIAHVGVNTGTEAEAVACASLFESLFGLPVNPAKESADARYTGTQIEWLKKAGKRQARPHRPGDCRPACRPGLSGRKRLCL